LSALSTNKRLRTALGGFVSFTGFIILLIVILSATGTTDIGVVFQNQTIINAIAFLGLLDVFCGILLYFSEKNFSNLFSSKKKKTDEDIQ
jgi:hypothetical protein